MKKEYAYFNKDGYLAYLASALDSTETREHIDVTEITHKFNFKKENGELIWKKWEIKEEPIVYNLEEEKLKKIKLLQSKNQALINSFKNAVPEFERETWNDQKEEYTAYLKDKTSPTVAIDTIAENRGVSKEKLIEKIGIKTKAIYKILGKQQKVEDKIKACKTKEELEAINV